MVSLEIMGSIGPSTKLFLSSDFFDDSVKIALCISHWML
ncbi:hypothetical protein GPUN_2531 [Glaciecola punicea ACAM 611]|uniref:Uncharacterized protein n=1 Tax=Glaciecola punicea ACAM 611 TaxID=1121923 RepID=H5TEB9_9ALTE|nr:hypothetical protein GPUN_2531 [Glaciecola punicea ACAM 611]